MFILHGDNKKWRCNKARFLQNTLRKTPSSRGSLIISYLSLCGREVGWGGRLFEAGRLFEVGANSRLGAYSNKYQARPPPPPPTLISRPNWGPKGWKKFFWRPGPPLSKGLDILELHMLRPQGYAVCPYTFRRELQNTKFVNLIVSVECGTTLNLLNFMGTRIARRNGEVRVSRTILCTSVEHISATE